MRIGVVGGGFSGLLSAAKLAKRADVEVYEEHSTIGYPRHCTGLVSEYVVSYLRDVAEGFVLNAFRRYILLHTLRPRDVVELRFRKKVYLIDRPRVERALAATLSSRGGLLNLRTRVTSLDVSRSSIVLADGSKRSYDLIVVAEGARNVISRSLGLCQYVSYLIGAQAFARCPNSLDAPYVLFGNDVSRDFFGWVVPVDEKNLIVGLADSSNIGAKLKHLVKYLALIDSRTALNTQITEVFGGLIPMSMPCRPTSDRVVGIGDAVSSTKPLSGGGAYGVCRQVSILEEGLAGLDDVYNVVKTYSLRVRGLTYELALQHMIKILVLRVFGSLQNFFLSVVESGMPSISLLDYDRYVPDLASIPSVLELTGLLATCMVGRLL